LARHEGEFEAAAETSLDLRELLEALAGAASAGDRARQDAIATCLSASEGWRDAAEQLSGAFAKAAARSGLTTDKDK
jgi:hypothetical protein